MALVVAGAVMWESLVLEADRLVIYLRRRGALAQVTALAGGWRETVLQGSWAWLWRPLQVGGPATCHWKVMQLWLSPSSNQGCRTRWTDALELPGPELLAVPNPITRKCAATGVGG